MMRPPIPVDVRRDKPCALVGCIRGGVRGSFMPEKVFVLLVRYVLNALERPTGEPSNDMNTKSCWIAPVHKRRVQMHIEIVDDESI
jgi:hypothetical protein